MPGPLTGLRVVDLTQVLSGPYCTMLLADLGADVIKVEPPGGDVARQWGPHLHDGDARTASYGGYFASVNRNKRGICLDLKKPAARAVLLELIGSSQVLVENFRVGVMDRLGLSYERLHAMFPGLVYAAVRGFGDPRTGQSPYVTWPAFDIIAQAMGGLLGITGADAEHPVKAGPGVGDIFPAALAAFGVLAAVRHAEATGEGQFLDVAMYDGVLALTERIVYQHSITGVSPEPQGNTHPLLCPYGVFPARDGNVTVAAPTNQHWRELTAAMGVPELASDPRLATNDARLGNAALVNEMVGAWTSARSTAEVVAVLAGRVPCGPVNRAADVVADPHVSARGMIHEVDHPSGRRLQVAGVPIKFLRTPVSPLRSAPELGQHTAEVLAELRLHAVDASALL